MLDWIVEASIWSTFLVVFYAQPWLLHWFLQILGSWWLLQLIWTLKTLNNVIWWVEQLVNSTRWRSRTFFMRNLRSFRLKWRKKYRKLITFFKLNLFDANWNWVSPVSHDMTFDSICADVLNMTKISDPVFKIYLSDIITSVSHYFISITIE